MALGDVIARLAVSLTLETAAFEEGANIAEKRIAASAKKFEALGKRLEGFGTRLSVGVTAPLVALGKASVDGFIQQEKAMADVEAALKSMGGASGKTAQELLKTSDALELRSLYDGDVILKQVTANLLTFGNVAGKQFDRAQQAALDMATRLGGEPQAAAIQLGKALNDPVKGITALTRVGVQFTDKQQATIKTLVKTGDVAGAQGIILSEVEKQFKGAAAAAADASPWRQAQVAIGQAGDAIGAAILPIIKPVGDAIAGMARAFASLPEPVQKTAVVLGVMAAAIGPIALALGPIITMMAPFLASLKLIAASQGVFAALGAGATGLAATFGPILVAVGAIYLAWKNWDKIAPLLQPLLDQLTAIGEGLGIVEQKAGATQAELAKDQGFRTFGENLRAVGEQAGSVFAALEKGSGDAGKWIFDHFTYPVGQGLADLVDAAGRAGVGFHNFLTSVGQYMDQLAARIHAALIGRLEAVWNGLKSKIDAAKNWFFDLYDAVVGHSYIPDMVDEIGQHMARLKQQMVDPAQKATQKAGDAFRDLAADVSSLMDQLFPEFARLQAMKNDLSTIDKGKAAGLLSGDVAQEARFRAMGGGREMSVSEGLLDQGPLGNIAGTFESTMDRLAKATGGLADKTRISTVKVADSFKDMAEKSLDALEGMVSAIKGGGFLDILSSAVGLFLQLGSTGIFGAGLAKNINSVPKYAGGTHNHPGGLAWVGERGPELVSMPRASKVFTNRESMGMMGGRLQVEVVANNNGFGAIIRNEAGQMIAEASPAIARGGAALAGQQASFHNSRRLA